MKKIVFVCHGNICRSPMAEYIMKYLINQEKLNDYFLIESRATSNEEIGNTIYYKAKNKLKEMNIPFNERQAKKLQSTDYETYDYIIGFDEENISNIKKILKHNNKIYKLSNFYNSNNDIIDPWYSNNFDDCYKEIYLGCKSLLDKIKPN